MFGFWRRKKSKNDDKKQKEEKKTQPTTKTTKKTETPTKTQTTDSPTRNRATTPAKRRTVVVKKRERGTKAGTPQKKKADFFMKLVLCGDGAVGKTAIRERYLGRGFSSSYLQTIGADFATTEKTLDVADRSRSVQYQIWDLAGQSEFGGVRSSYYEGCFGALMIFDITRPASFDNIETWIQELWTNSGRGEVPIILLGNKADLKDKVPEHVMDFQIETYLEKLNERCQKHNFKVEYLETSALTGKNIEEAFIVLGINVVQWILSNK